MLVVSKNSKKERWYVMDSRSIKPQFLSADKKFVKIGETAGKLSPFKGGAPRYFARTGIDSYEKVSKFEGIKLPLKKLGAILEKLFQKHKIDKFV